MGLNVTQKAAIDSYRSSKKLGFVVTDEYIAELIKKEMEQTGVVYSGFESLAKSVTKSQAKQQSKDINCTSIFSTQDVNGAFYPETSLTQKCSDEQLKKVLSTRLNTVLKNLEKVEKTNGFLSSTWSKFKNATSIGASSNKVRKQLESDIKSLKENSIPEAFKSITGLDYSVENINKFLNNQVPTKAEQALSDYAEGQEMAGDVIADIASGVAVVGIYTAAVAAAPFSGGASIVVGVAAAGASAATIKTGIKYADAKSGGREYTADNLKKDLATGAFSGVLAPITGGMGGAIGKTVATKVGIQAVKQVGKEVAEETVEQTTKGFVKTALTNPYGYEYVGGNILKRAGAYTAEMVTDGTLSGTIDGAFRTAYDGGSLKEVGGAAVMGGASGGAGAWFLGGGIKVFGRGMQKAFGKNDVHIDANQDIIRTDAINDLLNKKVDLDYAAAVLRDVDDLDNAWLGKPTKLKITNPKYFEELKNLELSFKNKEINPVEFQKRKRILKNKYEAIEKENLRAHTSIEKNLIVDENTYHKFLTKEFITADDIKLLFNSTKIKENYFTQKVEELIKEIPKEVKEKLGNKIIDYSRPLDEQNFETIAKLMNLHKEKHLKKWFIKTDGEKIENIQKLAMFAKVVDFTHQHQEFLQFDENQWDIVIEGVLKAPEKYTKSVLKYKYDSTKINEFLDGWIKNPEREIIEDAELISEYLNLFTVQKDFVVYRGEGRYGILATSNNKNLPDIVSNFTSEILEFGKSKEDIDKFIFENLLGQVLHQKRFLSTSMTKEALESHDGVICWEELTVKNGTHGSFIENYCVERSKEAEFLVQSGCNILIKSARYDNGKWFLKGIIN